MSPVRCAAQLGVMDSPIEAHFARDARAMKLPPHTRNYRFLEGRKFELDFAWPRLRFGVEIDGHVHRIRDRFDTDREKGALAILAGWTVLHVTGLHVRDGRAIAWARQALDLLSRPDSGAAIPPHMLACVPASGCRTSLNRVSEQPYKAQE
jgi:very-short-patch-repair endonuclease